MKVSLNIVRTNLCSNWNEYENILFNYKQC